MIKGTIEIFQSYGDTNKSLYKGSNMVVDGFRKTIADVMTFMPNPSGGGVMEVGVSSVSSYQIQAMTLGSAKTGFSQRDSRFWYSSMATSAENYQLLPVNDNATFEMWDCYSSVGFNQWKYDNAVDANLLKNPTLNKLSGWTVNYLKNNYSGVVTARKETVAEGEIDITRFELTAGQAQVTLQQRIVEMKLGGTYTLYTNGKATNARLDVRISRGRNNVPLEYYDFSSNKFSPRDKNNSNLQHTIRLKDYYDVDEFRFKLRGNERDQAFISNNEYFVEYIFPSLGFVDESFAPWDFNFVNPHIDIARLELCDERHQILRNPNFLEHQSLLMNNDFDILIPFTDSIAANPTACTQAGLYATPGWTQFNPLAQFSNNPGNTEEVSGLGAVFPLATNNKAILNNQTEGVVIYASSIDLDSSGAASVEQTFNLDRSYKNPFAFANNLAQSPELLNMANGQYDNNATLMLSFETLVSGVATAANCGYLEFSLTRDSDGFKYNFEPNSITQQNNMWDSQGSAYKVTYGSKDTWKQKGVQVLLPADASEETYRLRITGRGRTDGTNGFCRYAIRNFSFGKLGGWRTYVYDHSGVAKWSLSSDGARVKAGSVFSGLTLSATAYGTLNAAGTAYIDVRDSINHTLAPTRTQLVQNFIGLEPTKTYRVSVKGTRHSTPTPGFAYELKAKARAKLDSNNYNVLSLWMDDAISYSGTNRTTNLNPYSTNSLAHRSTHPFFSKGIEARGTSPLDWGLYISASGIADTNTVAAANLRANPGDYTLSMNVYNKGDSPSFFVLSSTGGSSPVFFNWDTASWDSIIGTIPKYRNSVSGSYFLPLPAGNNRTSFTPYTYTAPVSFPSVNSTLLDAYHETTPDGLGSRGRYKFTAALYGPNAEAGECLVSDLALKGPGLGPHVDIWKELYYNFSDNTWQPAATSALDYYSEDTDDTIESFISTPKGLITGMCLYGLDRDTEYQLNIIDTSGGIYTLHDVALQDVSFVNNNGRSRWLRDASKWTSEPYGNTHYSEYDNGAVFKFRNANNGSDILSNITEPSGMTAWATPGSIMFESASGEGASSNPIFVPVTRIQEETNAVFAPWLTQNITLGEYNIKGGDKFAFGLEGISVENGNDTIDLSVQAMYDGLRYCYDFTSRQWVPGFEKRNKTFTLLDNKAQSNDEFYSDAKTWSQIVTPSITAPLFGPTTKIIASFIVNAGGSAKRAIDVKEFKVYSWLDSSSNHYHVSGPSFNFPEFPSPGDATLQSVQPSGSPGELGHFLNRINFFNYYPTKLRSQATGTQSVSGLRAVNNPMSPSVTGEKTLEAAVSMGAFLPSAGLFFGSGTYGLQNVAQPYGFGASAGLVLGVLNLMGVVNSDGYIYRHPYTPTNMHDASAGFLVSSLSSTVGGGGYGGYGKKTLRYILKLHKDDWRFLDYYMGGLGAIGLNTLDYKKTYDKVGLAWQVSGTGAAYSQGSRVGLYKIADPDKNPVFNLTNKKVTFPPGLKIDYDTTEHITIIWDIDY